MDAVRPCPFVSCRYHLALDVLSAHLVVNFPDLELEEHLETCALDVADGGGATLEEVAEFLNLTRERIRQLEAKALVKVARRGVLHLFVDEGGENGGRRVAVHRALAGDGR